MKTLGLIGGMSWQSTASYYRMLNKGIAERMGGLHSAKILLNSLDFAPIAHMQAENNWSGMTDILTKAAQDLQMAGANGIMICTNTMHKVACQIQDELDVPLLNIIDATGETAKVQNFLTVGLLGTAFTMQQDFYKKGLADRHDLRVLVPNSSQQNTVHDSIYQRLCKGIITQEDRREFCHIIDSLAEQGAQAVVLGCTEIGLLITDSDSRLSLLDTTKIHVNQGIRFAMSEN
jgi:aspartate racemase